jgi:hypothetical protein
MGGIATGLGGYCAIAEGTNGATGASGAYGAYFEVPTRAVPVKSAKGTYDPHIVQGGPYIRYVSGGAVIDLGSANVATYLDAKVTLEGDFMNTAMALLLAQAFGGLARVGASGVPAPITLSQIGATTAYALMNTGATGASGSGGLYVQDGSWFDVELGVPSTDGKLHFEQYVNCKIAKAEWVFPRNSMVTFTYDLDACYVNLTDTSLATITEPAGPVPFTMPDASSLFTIASGASGAPVNIDGCRKATVTFTPKLADDRIYIGKQYKEEPVSNGLIEIAVALDMDYTPTAKSEIFDHFVSQDVLAQTVIAAVGNAIGVSTHNDQLQIVLPGLKIQSGGEAPLVGVDIVKNTINLKGVLDVSGNSPSARLITADTGF